MAAASDERTNAQCRASLCSCFFLEECERGVGVETRVASLSPPPLFIANLLLLPCTREGWGGEDEGEGNPYENSPPFSQIGKFCCPLPHDDDDDDDAHPIQLSSRDKTQFARVEWRQRGRRMGATFALPRVYSVAPPPHLWYLCAQEREIRSSFHAPCWFVLDNDLLDVYCITQMP